MAVYFSKQAYQFPRVQEVYAGLKQAGMKFPDLPQPKQPKATNQPISYARTIKQSQPAKKQNFGYVEALEIKDKHQKLREKWKEVTGVIILANVINLDSK